MMGTLDGGESELETTSPPPPVIQPEDKVSQQGKIDELKLGLAEEKINSYLDDFENRMEEEILMIGQISLEEVQVNTIKWKEKMGMKKMENGKMGMKTEK